MTEQFNATGRGTWKRTGRSGLVLVLGISSWVASPWADPTAADDQPVVKLAPQHAVADTERPETTPRPQVRGIFANLGDENQPASTAQPPAAEVVELPASESPAAVSEESEEASASAAIVKVAARPGSEAVRLPPVKPATPPVAEDFQNGPAQPAADNVALVSETAVATVTVEPPAAKQPLLDPNRFRRANAEVERLPATDGPVKFVGQQASFDAAAAPEFESIATRTVNSGRADDRETGRMSEAPVVMESQPRERRDDTSLSSPNRFLRLPQTKFEPASDRSLAVIPATRSMPAPVRVAARVQDPIVPDVTLPQDEAPRGDVELGPLDKQPLRNLALKPNQGTFGEAVPPNSASDLFGQYEQGLVINEVVRTREMGDDQFLWNQSVALWEAPAFFHRPLYFEQVNVERYGHYRPYWQPAISGAHFFTSIAFLPYKMGVNDPCEPIYTLGHHRPGSCNPHQRHHLPFSWRGVAYQGISTTGLLFSLPTIP